MFCAIVAGCGVICRSQGKKTSGLAFKLPAVGAIGLDVLGGITTLVVGILSLTAPHLGITLTPAAQWAMIGVGATNTGVFLLAFVTVVKLSVPSIMHKNLC